MVVTEDLQKSGRHLPNFTIIDITTSPINSMNQLSLVSTNRHRNNGKNNINQTKTQHIKSNPITKHKFPSYLYDPKCHSVKIARKRWGNMIH